MPATNTAKALVLPTKQGSFVIRDVEVRKPVAGEILIKILATSLNPIDWKIHKWCIAYEEYPAILGNDIAGEVVEIGESVTDFKVGDKVFGQGHFEPDRGSFQQYIVALASTTAKIPPNISIDEAASIPAVLTAAYVALYNKIPHGLGIDAPVSEAAQGKYAGTPILIFGGNGSVGQMALQLAKLSGFSPIITTASPGQTQWLESLGATNVLDRNLSSADLIKEVRKLTKDSAEGLKYVLDAVASNDNQKAGFELLIDGGKIAILSPVAVIESTDKKTVSQVFGSLRVPYNVVLLEALYHDKLYDLLQNGVIKPNKVEVLPNGLAGIPDGLDRLEANKVSGRKLVAHPQETV